MASRGSVWDIPYILVILFIMATSIVIGWVVYSQFYVQMDAAGLKTDVMVDVKNQFTFLDQAFVFLLVGVFIATIISAYFIETHPLLFFFILMFGAFMLIIGAMLANVYHQMVTSTSIASYASDYPMISLIFGNYPLFVLIFFGLVVMAYLIRPKEIGGAGGMGAMNYG